MNQAESLRNAFARGINDAVRGKSVRLELTVDEAQKNGVVVYFLPFVDGAEVPYDSEKATDAEELVFSHEP